MWQRKMAYDASGFGYYPKNMVHFKLNYSPNSLHPHSISIETDKHRVRKLVASIDCRLGVPHTMQNTTLPRSCVVEDLIF